MSSNIKQVVPAALKALVVLLTILLFFSTARAQMNDSNSGALGGAGGLDPSSADSDSQQNGVVGNTMRRGCVDPTDPNADESGLPPCTNNSDNNDNSNQSSPGTSSTLSGGSAGMGGSSAMGGASAMRGAQGLGGAQGFA